MNPDGTVTICSDFRKNGLARKVPDSFFADSEWRLPPDPDPESARYALRFFPSLATTEPELVAAARMSACDFTPVDFSTARWVDRPTSDDPWPRVLTAMRGAGMEPHMWQRMDADYFIANLEAGKGGYSGAQMGLAKTAMALMVCEGWDANFVLIVAPNSAKRDPWLEHIERFAPWLKPLVVGNTPKQRAAALDEAEERLNAGEPTALIVHFEAVPLVEKMGAKTVSGWRRFGRWDLLIVDEAHALKSRTAQRTAAIRRLDRVGTLLLSGSVMSGRAEELFVPLQILQPKVYRSQHRDWNSKYLEVVEDDFGHDVIVGPAIHKLSAMRAALGEVLVVRHAADHLRVPAPIEVQHSVDLYPEQARVYREVADDLMAALPDGDTLYATDGAPLISALRRVTGGIPQPEGGLLSSKLDRAMELIASAGDSQLLVFSWHKAPVAELQRRCLDAGISCGLVNGDVSREDRESAIDLHKRGGYRVLAATIATLSTAANLQHCGAVIFLEESYNSIDNEQAMARVVRQGQPAHVSVHWIRAKNTVDDLRVLPAAVAKHELRRLVLGSSVG